MFQSLLFILSVSFVKAIASLPLKFLYLFEKPLFYLLYYVVSYRNGIVTRNLEKSFPDYSEERIRDIKKSFYRYFSVNIIETIKLTGFSQKKLSQHIHYKNPELLDKYYSEGRHVTAIAAHYGNWEWLLGLAAELKHTPLAIYKPLNNEKMNAFLIRKRQKFGAKLIGMSEVPRELLKLKQENRLSITMFIADQSPVWEETQYWTDFLNQQTAVYLGPEKMARKLNSVVVYYKMSLKERGQYEVEVIPISENPLKEEPYAITDKYFSYIGETIKEKPEYWLWSHNRWKLTRRRKREEASGKFRFEGKFKRNT